MAGGDVHPLGTPNLPCICTPPMPRAPYWVFGSWVQPTGWVLVAVGVLVSAASAALIVHHHHRRGVPVAASAAVVLVAVSPAVGALGIALALWVVQLTATTSASLVLTVVLGVPAAVVAMSRRGDESPGRLGLVPGPALPHAAAASRKVL